VRPLGRPDGTGAEPASRKPAQRLCDLLIWKSTFHYCGYVREVRYVDQTILKSYEVPKRLTLYRSVLGTGERDWFILQIIVEWVLLGALALGYTMYKDGVLLFAIHSMVRGIDRALGVN
jgi:hypothetical protein